MKTYLTGGYIRDEMLGVPSHDRDFVVVETLHRKRLSVLKDYINSVS